MVIFYLHRYKRKIFCIGDGPEKPREIYVPPEPTNDLAEMFSTAISSGINFDKYDNIPVEVRNGPRKIIDQLQFFF